MLIRTVGARGVGEGEAPDALELLVHAAVLRPLHGRVSRVHLEGVRGDEVGRVSDGRDVGELRRGAPVALELGSLAPVDLTGQ